MIVTAWAKGKVIDDAGVIKQDDIYGRRSLIISWNHEPKLRFIIIYCNMVVHGCCSQLVLTIQFMSIQHYPGS